MWNRDAEPFDAQSPHILHELTEDVERHTKRDVHRVYSSFGKCGVVNLRTKTVANRVSHNAVHCGIRIDVIVPIYVHHLLVAELTRRERPLMMKCCIRER